MSDAASSSPSTDTRRLNVLVATDGSHAAIAAAKRAIDLFGHDVHVVLAAVVLDREDPAADAGGFEGPLLTEDEATQEFAERQAAAEAEIADTTAALDVTVESHIVPTSTDPGPALVDLVTQYGADVLVVGASGKGALRRFFSGSVSDYLVHHSPCPVLVVRDEHLHHD